MASRSGSGSDLRSPFQSLPRQGSIYSLTLNEVQSHLGEPLHSMNLDDLLKSVFLAETSQISMRDLDSASSQYAVSSNSQSQGSITLPRGLTLSKKTVDEVWTDIQQGSQGEDEESTSSHERQPTLCEMTLEDFLKKAGTVADDGVVKGGNDVISGTKAVGNSLEAVVGTTKLLPRPHWSHYRRMRAEQHVKGQRGKRRACGSDRPLLQRPSECAGPFLDSVYPDLSTPLATLSDPRTPGRKRGACNDAADTQVDRRQKRMIKNRESAARSRARKQAYTNELESKVIRLEEENEWLRKQQELERILHSSPAPEPKYRLRKTSSTLF